MEVKIKKTKLTKSIIDQITVLSQKEITDNVWTPIGWCVYKSNTKLIYRLIILSDGEGGGLRKIPMYNDIVDSEEGLMFKTSSDKVRDIYFAPETLDEWKDIRTYGWKLLTSAKEKGQFFI